MINPYYFTDRNMKVGFKNNLETHQNIHAKFELAFTPNYPEFGIEVRYVNKKLKDLSVIYAKLINQYYIKYQTVFQQGLINRMKLIKY